MSISQKKSWRGISILFILVSLTIAASIHKEAHAYDPKTCKVTSAIFKPSGVQPDGWYKGYQKNYVRAEITTNDCKGQTLKVYIMQDGVRKNHYWKHNIVAESEIFPPEFYIGTYDCSVKSGPSNDCVYSLETILDRADTDHYTSSGDSGTLSFDCQNGTCASAQDFSDNTGRDHGIILSNDPSGGTSTNKYVFLSPLPNPEQPGTNLTELDVSQPSSLGKYITIIIGLFVGLCGVLAVVMFIFGGIQYMTSEVISSKESAKEHMTNAILGLLLVLGSYVILKKINPDILEFNFGSIQQVTVQYETDDDSPLTTKTKTDGTKVYVDSKGTEKKVLGQSLQDGPWPMESIKDLVSLYRDKFKTAGATVKNNECVNVGDKDCTSTYFTQATGDALVQKIKTIKSGCNGCEITITGGSEVWRHATHSVDKTVLDFRALNDKMSEYISKKTSFPADCKSYKNNVGIFVAEAPNKCPWGIDANHWHMR